MKKVWILNHYAGNMYFDKGGRHYNFAKFLHIAGYDVSIFCCNAKHNSNSELYFDTQKLWHEHCAEEINTPFVFVKGRTYIGNGKQRILNMLDFYFNVQNVAKKYAKENGRPDVIIGSSVHPLTCVAAIRLSKIFKCKNIVEIRDLWPESFVAFGLINSNNPIVKLLYAGERWIYKKSDAVIFSMEGGADYIREHGWDKEHGGPIDMGKIHHINNGVVLSEYDHNKEEYTIDDPDLNDPKIFKIVYSGSIRRANNVGLLIDLAKKISEKNIKFLIWGAGDQVDELKQRLIDEKISNVVFKGKVDKKYIPFINSRANLTVLNYQDATGIFRFGGSQNKLFEYFASGTPVMYNIKMGYDLIKRYNCGFYVDYSNIDRIAEKLCEFMDLPKELYESYCTNARRAAEDYDFKKLTDKLIKILAGE